MTQQARSPLLEVGLLERPSGLLDNLDVVQVSRALESEHGVHGQFSEAILLVRQQLRAQGRPEKQAKGEKNRNKTNQNTDFRAKGDKPTKLRRTNQRNQGEHTNETRRVSSKGKQIERNQKKNRATNEMASHQLRPKNSKGEKSQEV